MKIHDLAIRAPLAAQSKKKKGLQIFVNVLVTLRCVFVKYLDYVFVYYLCFQTDSFYGFGMERRI